MKLTIHLYLVMKSRRCGAVPPLPQYAFVAWCSLKRRHRDILTFALLIHLGVVVLEAARTEANITV
jgi:hypothetical protein